MTPSLDTVCRVRGVIKEMFNNKFDMKDLGVADVILGIKISKTSDGLIYLNHITLRKFLRNSNKMIAVQ